MNAFIHSFINKTTPPKKVNPETRGMLMLPSSAELEITTVWIYNPMVIISGSADENIYDIDPVSASI